VVSRSPRLLMCILLYVSSHGHIMSCHVLRSSCVSMCVWLLLTRTHAYGHIRTLPARSDSEVKLADRGSGDAQEVGMNE
jgi:hypothetical protein